MSMNLLSIVCVGVLGAASLLGASSASAKAFYVSQSSSRTTGGASCSDALSVAWFNNTSSWGTASSQIGPGTTVYLCGMFSGSAGGDLLTVRGSGSAGSPITIKFLSGTVLTAPYWAGYGAIHMDNLSHVVVDGGTNGVIQNTANGTGRAYRQSSIAVHARNCTGCTVQNLTIQNLYVRTSISDLAPTASVNCVYFVASNNFTINKIICHDATWALAGEGNNFTLAYSDFYHVDHGLASGAAGTVSNYRIYNNHFHDFANWDSGSANKYHHDGIHMWGQNGGRFVGGAIYNNTFDGDFGVNITAHIYLQDSVSGVAVYNNVFVTPTTRTINSVWLQAASTSLPGGPASGNSVYNNSINAGGRRAGAPLVANNQFLFTAVNNILAGGLSDISVQGGGSRSVTGINNNIYRDLFAEFGDRNTFGFRGLGYYLLSQWQAACRCDSASKLITSAQTTAFSIATETATTVAGTNLTATVDVNGAMGADAAVADAVNLSVVTKETTKDPGLDLLYTVGEGNGINLTDIASDGLAPLAFDKNGVQRPVSGPWNVGPF
jgi:hypothetical protein